MAKGNGTAHPTFDARDPHAPFPPFVPLRPSPGLPDVSFVLLDDAARDLRADASIGGVIVNQGGVMGGWVFVKDGRPTFCNLVGVVTFTIAPPVALSAHVGEGPGRQ